jgi:O-antigen ligase
MPAIQRELPQNRLEQSSWVLQLPNQAALLLTSTLIVLSQWNPCDTVMGIAGGDSLPLMVLSIAIGFFVAINWFLDRKESESLGVHWFFVSSCIAFACWLRFATHFQVQYANGRYSLNGCWQWISQIVLLLSLIQLCRIRRVADSLVTLLVSCATGTVAITLFQYFYTLPKDRFTFAQDPNLFLEQLGVVPGSSDAMLYASRLGSLEPTGPFALTNSLAGFMLIWIVFLVAVAVLVSSRGIKTKDVRRSLCWLMGILVILTYAIWLTRSRSALLAMGVGIASVLWFVPHVREQCLNLLRVYRIVFIGLASCFIIVIAYVAVREPKLFTDAGKSLSYRFEYWQGAWKIVQMHPWYGVGSGNFQSSYAQVKAITASETPADPHNFLVEVTCVGGIPLLIFLLAILLAIAYPFLCGYSRQQNDKPASNSSDKSGMEFDSTKGSGLIAIGAILACSCLLAFYYLANNDETSIASFLFFSCGCVTWIGINNCRIPFSGQEMRIACVLSAGALLLHLCFSGGWMTPGLMCSFSILVSLGLRSECHRPSGTGMFSMAPRSVLSPVMRRVSLSILLLAATFDLARTFCIPLLATSDELALDPNFVTSRSVDDWLKTMLLDRWDPALPRRVANRCVQVLTKRNLSREEKAKWLAAFDVASQEFLRRDSNHWSAAAECGRWHMFLGEKEHGTEEKTSDNRATLDHRRMAMANFNLAAELYPNSASCQLQAAVAAAWVGDSEITSEKIEAALKIDRATVHLDRKIQASVVIFPYTLETTGAKLPTAAREALEPMAARGEPVLDWLRNRQQ